VTEPGVKRAYIRPAVKRDGQITQPDEALPCSLNHLNFAGSNRSLTTRHHLVVGRSIVRCARSLDRHWLELGGGICGKTALESDA
jgi:hypothetical protein